MLIKTSVKNINCIISSSDPSFTHSFIQFDFPIVHYFRQKIRIWVFVEATPGVPNFFIQALYKKNFLRICNLGSRFIECMVS